MHGDWRRPRDHVRACLGLGFSGSLPSAATPDPKNSTLGSYEFPHTSPEWGSEGGRVHGDWRRPRDHEKACLGLGFSEPVPRRRLLTPGTPLWEAMSSAHASPERESRGQEEAR
jgi:hypothetical protein